MTRAFSGRALESVTIEAAVAGQLTADDVRIHPDALRAQAQAAEADGNPQLGANLRRAAELATVSEREILTIYEALRPNRSSAEELEQIAADLERRGAPACAALVRETVTVYGRRGLTR